MGSSLASLMADFALHIIESKLTIPKIYLRYVYYIFLVFALTPEVFNFLDKLNSLHSNIKFIIKVIIDNKIKFLDMEVKLIDNSLQTN